MKETGKLARVVSHCFGPWFGQTASVADGDKRRDWAATAARSVGQRRLWDGASRDVVAGLSVLLLAVAGCQTPEAVIGYEPPQPEAVQLQGLEPGEPVEVVVDPGLEGEHDADFYVQQALERNPEIQAAEHAAAAAAQRIPQAVALDDPVLTDSFQPLPDASLQTAAGRAPNLVALSQRFPWFGKLRLRGQIAEQEAQIALTRLVQTQLKVTEQVRLAYAEVWFNQEAIAITEHSRELLEDLLQFADARYRAGQTSQQDVLRAQVEVDRLDDRLIQLRRQLKQAQADLAALLHTSPEADLRAKEVGTESVPEQLDALYQAAIRCRPELQEQLHAIIAAQRAQELARLQYFPDATLGVGWQAITDDSHAVSPVANGDDNVIFGIGINLPIWYDRLNAAVRESDYRLMQTAQQYEFTKDDTFRLIRRLVVQAKALEEQLDLFRHNIIPRSEQALRVSAADYRVGRVDFEQVLDNWTDLLAFQLQEARLQASLYQTMASLERVVGCELAEIPELQASKAQGSPEPTRPGEMPTPEQAKPVPATKQTTPGPSKKATPAPASNPAKPSKTTPAAGSKPDGPKRGGQTP